MSEILLQLIINAKFLCGHLTTQIISAEKEGEWRLVSTSRPALWTSVHLGESTAEPVAPEVNPPTEELNLEP